MQTRYEVKTNSELCVGGLGIRQQGVTGYIGGQNATQQGGGVKRKAAARYLM